MHKSLLPVEKFVFIALILVYSMAEITGMKWYFPEERSFDFVTEHYIGPLVPLFLITAVLALTGRQERK